jgi:hypothetical protein
MSKLYIHFKDGATDNDLLDYIGQFKHTPISSDAYIVETDKLYHSMFCNFWQHLGSRGLLVMIDLECPEKEFTWSSVNSESGRRFLKERASLQKELSEFLSR